MRSAWAQPSAPMCGNVMVVPASSSGAALLPTSGFSLQNTGGAPFTVTGISSSNTAFTVAMPAVPFTVNPSQTVNVTMNVACPMAGTQMAAITIAAQDAMGNAITCPGVNLSAECKLCCSVTTEGNANPLAVNNGGNDQKTFTITNCGDVSFQVTGLGTPPGFSAVPAQMTPTLAPGASVVVTVTYNNECSGDQLGNITIMTTPDASCPPVPVLGVCRTA